MRRGISRYRIIYSDIRINPIKLEPLPNLPLHWTGSGAHVDERTVVTIAAQIIGDTRSPIGILTIESPPADEALVQIGGTDTGNLNLGSGGGVVPQPLGRDTVGDCAPAGRW